MVHIADKVVKLFIRNNVVKEMEYDIYFYGMKLFLGEMINISLILLIGMLCGRRIETIVFLLAFIPIRVFAGGYHASCRRNCTLVFTGSYMCLCCVWNYIILSNSVLESYLYVLMIIADIVILRLAPVEHKKRPFEPNQVPVYRRKIRIRLLFVNMVVVLTIFMSNRMKEMGLFIILALFLISILLIVESIKNIRYEANSVVLDEE
ncbi:accessory gene regulator B [Aequitasia blattaphilus]|uniref:Accessory gene regulator B family protein n=1 Tax=Aequitasia blattaphilus TaxID=2949332 RepID=A0ABT1EBZ3_9FIRM|nr:accessory gene regulator B family protein [Aequitasia blattaphilus]MCP1103350.1 accessory gene regulator B family protein [Aequitasia blattaphilus]MCR8615990.1 accessory gene regulator B family protein [Aequitasia blattaphilus]